jgi:hypothetical protein
MTVRAFCALDPGIMEGIEVFGCLGWRPGFVQ